MLMEQLAVMELMLILNPEKVSPKKNECGYSLLEILIVLTILGLSLSVVNVPLAQSYGRVKISQTAKKIVNDIKHIRIRALIEQEATLVILSPNRVSSNTPTNISKKQLNMPAGWKAEGDNITISANGFCQGGYLKLTAPNGRVMSYSLLSPSCLVERII